MSDFFSSALSYFTGGSEGGASNRFVGQVVELGGESKLKVKKVIAEGGYGYVFIAQDVRTGKDYALKRQVVPKENVKIIKQEIAFLKQLGNHPHIVNYVASAGCPPSQTSHGSAEFLIQTELCNGGRMEDVVRSLRLSPRQVLRVFFETCSAVAHMHSQKPPIIHRDLKVENLLLSSRGTIKLCDFGSATTQRLHPDHSWTAVQRGLAEDEIQRNTTPMYRSPEMIDLYSNYPVNEKADIWALGCLLYMLCFQEHPFEDSAKLRILNANYRIPPEDTTFTAFHNIIRTCLIVDPSNRPSVDSIMAQLYSIADQLGENLDKPASEPLLAAAAQSDAETSTDSSSSSSGVSSALQSTSHQAQRFFGFMKDGAGNLFKNIRESSSKVIHGMSGSGTKHSALDITYITSRILAMSFPHDDSSHANNIDEVSAFLNEKHPSQYLVFNLSGHDYDISKFDNQVADFDWPHKHVPDLEKLVDLCRNLDSWLRADPQNIIVVHCHDGHSITSIVVAAYLLFLGTFLSPTIPLKLFSLKRNPELLPITGTPGQLRYLQYIADLVGPKGYKPHPHPASLRMLRITTVPRFNAIKTGCKPFVEVFQNSERLYTSVSQDNMEHIKSFAASEDRVVEIPLNVMVNGNVIVVVHHIRAVPADKMSGMGMTAIRMFQFQLHTGFISPDTTTVTLDRSDLDGSSVNKEDKLPSPFQVILELEFDRSEGVRDKRSAISWQNLPHPRASPLTCFTSHTEEQEVLQMFAELDRNAAVNQQQKQPEISTVTANLMAPSASLLDEESTSAGGNLLNIHLEETATHGSGGHHDFYSQLDWQEGGEPVGYVAYEDQDKSSGSSSGSSSSGSSSGSEEELRQMSADPFSAAKSSVMTNPTSEHFANFEAAFGAQNASAFRPVQPPVQQREEEEKLIEFSFTEDVETANQAPQVFSQQPQQKVEGGRALNGIFGEHFDPWKGTIQVAPGQQKGGAGVTNLLNLEESDDEQSSVSMQSELRAVGTESFGHVLKSSQPTQPKQMQSSRSASGLNDFDPFGPASSSGGGDFLNLLAPTLTPLHPSTSAPNLSTQLQQPRQVPPNNFHLSKGSSQGSKWNHTTTSVFQHKPTFGKPNYAPGLSTIGGSQSDLSDTTLSQWGGRGGYPRGRSGYPGSETTSPYSTSPRTSPVPFGAHSSSTGNLTHGFHGVNIQAQQPTSKPDPFAEFGNVKMMSGARTAAANGNPAGTGKLAPPMTSRPAYQIYSQKQPVSQPQPQRSQSPRPFQPPRSHSPRPAFGSVFGDGDRGGGGAWTRMGVPQSVASERFSDLLEGHNFSGSKDKEPKSLKEMKAKNNIEQALDPDRARVIAWAEGKERNIRALLNSLHEILWEGETRWTKVEMHQLLQPEQVKKVYRKACLSVHPDKTQDTNHANLARAIFDELNDAYTRFEETGAKPLFL